MKNYCSLNYTFKHVLPKILRKLPFAVVKNSFNTLVSQALKFKDLTNRFTCIYNKVDLIIGSISVLNTR